MTEDNPAFILQMIIIGVVYLLTITPLIGMIFTRDEPAANYWLNIFIGWVVQIGVIGGLLALYIFWWALTGATCSLFMKGC